MKRFNLYYIVILKLALWFFGVLALWSQPQNQSATMPKSQKAIMPTPA